MFPAKKIMAVAVLAVISVTAFAQTPKSPVRIQKFKPPKLTSMLGIRNDSATVAVEEAVQLLGLPIKVSDDKKNTYTISSYQFLYRKRGVVENEETKEITPVTSIVADRFTTSPLPTLWVDRVKEQLQTGEEFIFFDIVVKDAQGRLMFAPVIKIKIK